MALFAAIATVASSALSAFGSHKAGKAERAAARARAETFEANARFTEAERPAVSEQFRLERRRLANTYHAVVGDFVAQSAASGIDPNAGSAAQAVADAKSAYDTDRRILAKNEGRALEGKDREAYNYRRQALVSRKEGDAAYMAGNLRAFATLLQGASTASTLIPGRA